MSGFYRLCRAAAMGLALAAAIFGAAAASAWAEGPSFDCAKAKTPVELPEIRFMACPVCIA
jgi:hypothetical protein